MLVKRPWGITNLERQDNGNYRFDAVILKSTGWTTIHGCLFSLVRHRVYMPSIRYGAKYCRIVDITKADNACLKRLVEMGIAAQAKEELIARSINESSEPASDSIEDRQGTVGL